MEEQGLDGVGPRTWIAAPGRGGEAVWWIHALDCGGWGMGAANRACRVPGGLTLRPRAHTLWAMQYPQMRQTSA
jgi:hypothetical protein